MLRKYHLDKKLTYLLFICVIFLSALISYSIFSSSSISGPSPIKIIGLVLVDMILILLMSILISWQFFKKHYYNLENKWQNSKLQNRIIFACIFAAALPTTIVTIFSLYFFYFGVQNWFDKKVVKVLDQSVEVAQSYIYDNTLQLKQAAMSIVDDFVHMGYAIIYNPQYFNQVLNAQVEMRSLDEAIVFQSSTNTILAQSALSFSLAFANIPIFLIQKADSGEVVEVKSSPNKIRMLVKLKDVDSTYLLIGRLIDKKIIEHIDKTNGAANEYYNLKQHISSMQIKFFIIFICAALILLASSIIFGVVFSSRIIFPIRRLVEATDKAKEGDLTVQVPEQDLYEDEIRVLSVAFNRMIKQIYKQQNDLLIAQSALAWSDVARRVAHEIKNPLTPIQLASSRLWSKFSREVSDQGSFKKYIDIIDRHANDIKKIVAEFVNFARLPLPTFEKCNLVSVIKDAVEARRLINEGISYIFDTVSENIEFVCDVTQLHQVMINLLKNAEESGDTISSKLEIIITVRQVEDEMIIQVKDNGPGFPKDLINQVIEPYVSTRSKGMGLGLAIVKKILSDHYGNIKLENNPQGGAMITLSFDLIKLQRSC